MLAPSRGPLPACRRGVGVWKRSEDKDGSLTVQGRLVRSWLRVARKLASCRSEAHFTPVATGAKPTSRRLTRHPVLPPMQRSDRGEAGFMPVDLGFLIILPPPKRSMRPWSHQPVRPFAGPGYIDVRVKQLSREAAETPSGGQEGEPVETPSGSTWRAGKPRCCIAGTPPRTGPWVGSFRAHVVGAIPHAAKGGARCQVGRTATGATGSPLSGEPRSGPASCGEPGTAAR